MSEIARKPEDSYVWPTVNILAPGAVRRWLAAGWADVAAAPWPSLFYGTVLAAMGYLLITFLQGAAGIAFTAGFLLVGPFLAIAGWIMLMFGPEILSFGFMGFLPST